ncbi:MAG TPA: tetratricopeptide repeat protein [Myxococcaceae bacterium]|nr:tetratricopeptide repeat protein [Myxococcaceae bacterium]
MRGWAPVAAVALAACTHESASGLSAKERAVVSLQKGRPEAALDDLAAARREAPEDLDLARLEVEANAKLGRLDALISRLDAQKARPSAVTWYMLGLAQFARAADAEPAASAFHQALQLAPQSAEIHYRLGVALLESEHYEQALPPLEKARELAPEREGIALPLAKALYRTGRRGEAVEALRKLVSQNPTPREIETARALMDAIADPFVGIPQAARAKIDEGLNWLQIRESPDNAILSFEDVLHEYPDLAGVHALLGLAYEKIDDAGLAVDELRRATELAPDDGKTLFYLGDLYASRQRVDQARDCLEKAIAKNPLLDAAYARLGDLALDRRDLPRAREYYRILCVLQPDSPPARGKLALALQLDGDFAGAEKELKRVLDKDEDNVEFMLRLGMLFAEKYAHTSRPEERAKAATDGVKWLEEVLKRQPDNALASRALDSLKPR